MRSLDHFRLDKLEGSNCSRSVYCTYYHLSISLDNMHASSKHISFLFHALFLPSPNYHAKKSFLSIPKMDLNDVGENDLRFPSFKVLFTLSANLWLQ